MSKAKKEPSSRENRDKAFSIYGRHIKKPSLFCGEEIPIKKTPRNKNKQGDNKKDNPQKVVDGLFLNMITTILKQANLKDKEDKKVSAFNRKMNESAQLQSPMYTKDGFLITSSNGKNTYTVNIKPLDDSYRFVCNCGDSYRDYERTSCIHVGRVITSLMEHFIRDSLYKKDQELNSLNNMFNNFNINESSKQNIETIREDFLSLMNK